ncbi:hypothetical protein D3C74_444040 [compost metagenome]
MRALAAFSKVALPPSEVTSSPLVSSKTTAVSPTAESCGFFMDVSSEISNCSPATAAPSLSRVKLERMPAA